MCGTELNCGEIFTDLQQILFPKRKAVFQVAATRRIRKAAALADPAIEGAVALHVAHAFTEKLAAPHHQALGHVDAVTTDMDHLGVGEDLQPQRQGEGVARVFPAPGEIQALEGTVTQILADPQIGHGPRGRDAHAQVVYDQGPKLGICPQGAHRLRVIPGPAGLTQQPVVEVEKEGRLVVDLLLRPHEQTETLQHPGDHGGPRAVHADDDHRGPVRRRSQANMLLKTKPCRWTLSRRPMQVARSIPIRAAPARPGKNQIIRDIGYCCASPAAAAGTRRR